MRPFKNTHVLYILCIGHQSLVIDTKKSSVQRSIIEQVEDQDSRQFG